MPISSMRWRVITVTAWGVSRMVMGSLVAVDMAPERRQATAVKAVVQSLVEMVITPSLSREADIVAAATAWPSCSRYSASPA